MPRGTRRKRGHPLMGPVPRLPGGDVGVPSYLDTTVRYIGTRSINLVASLLDVSYWRLNGLYDPDTSSTGGQPLFFDQYMSMYAVYCVTRTRVVARLSGTMSASSAFQPKFGMVPVNSGIAISWPADFVTPMCRPGAKHAMVMANRSLPVLSSTYDIAAVIGVPRSRVIVDSTFHGDDGNNPLQQAALAVMVQNTDAGTTFTCNLEVELTFHVRFFIRRNVNAS